MTDTHRFLEAIMGYARTELKANHALLVAAVPEFEALLAEHTLTYKRRRQLLGIMERWARERGWFLCNGWGPITFADVCAGANSDIDVAREFYRPWLTLPFDARRVFVRLRKLRNVRKECGICAGRRSETPRSPGNKGGTPGKGVSGSSGPSFTCAHGVGGTETSRWSVASTSAPYREATSPPWLRGVLSVFYRGSRGMAL